MGKARKSNTVTIQVPAELVERIAQLNNVDLKYIDRTIARILRDEIAVEEKLSQLQGKETEKPCLHENQYINRRPQSSH